MGSKQTGIKDSTFGDHANIEIHQITLSNLPVKSTNIPSDVKQGSSYFVGRIRDLENLHRELQNQEKSNIVSIYAVQGMGGIGKTELAIQYALSPKYIQSYTACYWFSLREGDLATLVLTKTSAYLAMPEIMRKQDTIDQQVRWCWQNWHPQTDNILIVIDDVNHLEDIPEKWLPIDSRFKVIITTRQQNLSPRFTGLPLGVLSETEAICLLKKIVDKKGTNRIENEGETAKKICQRLGYLPLGLELAATYIVDDEMLSLEEYLQQLNIQDESLSDEMVRGITAERGVIAAFELSWQKLTGFSTYLAMLLSRFTSADIPWLELIEPTINQLGWDIKAIKVARKQLANLNLIEIIEQKNIRIHTLLREYYRYHSKKAGSHFIQQVQKSIAMSCLAVAKTIPQTPVIKDIERVTPSIPHLQYLSQTMLDDIPNPDDNLIWAFVGVAWFYAGQGQYDIAEPFYQRCLDEITSRLGENHPSTATSLNNLAGLYGSQGRYSEAEPLYLRALSIIEQQLGENHPDTATSLNNLAGFYETQGKYQKAETLAQRALTIYLNTVGEQHPHTLNSLLMVKLLQVMKLLSCNKQTLIEILQALAEQANVPKLNPESALTLLDVMLSNPELLQNLREAIQTDTEEL